MGVQKRMSGLFRNSKNQMCLPLVVYTVIALLGVLSSVMMKPAKSASMTHDEEMKNRIYNGVASLVWFLLWFFVIAQLCRRGHEGWAWVVVLLPAALLLVVMFMVLGLAYEARRHQDAPVESYCQ